MVDTSVAQVEAALRSAHELWLPGLAGVLTQHWKRQSGADSAGYLTTRFSGQEGCLPLWVHKVKSHGRVLTTLEVVPADIERRYLAQGLVSLTPEEAEVKLKQGVIQAGLSEMTLPRSLLAAVTTLAKATHLLHAAGEGTDVSHSDPELPFSIFISVPNPDERYAAFRLAEGCVHEAMHLQLSLIERALPLVDLTSTSYYSPWRKVNRPLAGVLHGLYVFAVIHQWLLSYEPARAYAEQRLPEIRDEVQRLAAFPSSAGFTPAGAALSHRLVDSVLLLI